MKYFRIAAISLLFVAGCNTAKPRPMSLYCGMPKALLIDRISGALVAAGYEIKFASVDAGTVQAEMNMGASFGVESDRHVWSIAVKRDTIIVNAKDVAKSSFSSSAGETVTTIDEENGNRVDWFTQMIDRFREVCSSTPIKSE